MRCKHERQNKFGLYYCGLCLIDDTLFEQTSYPGEFINGVAKDEFTITEEQCQPDENCYEEAKLKISFQTYNGPKNKLPICFGCDYLRILEEHNGDGELYNYTIMCSMFNKEIIRHECVCDPSKAYGESCYFTPTDDYKQWRLKNEM